MAQYNSIKYQTQVNGDWLQYLGIIGAESFTVDCEYLDNSDPEYPYKGRYRGQGPNGEEVFVWVYHEDGTYQTELEFIFKTITPEQMKYQVLVNGDWLQNLGILGGSIISAELQLLEPQETDPNYPFAGTYRGMGTNGEQITLMITVDGSNYFGQLHFLFETIDALSTKVEIAAVSAGIQDQQLFSVLDVNDGITEAASFSAIYPIAGHYIRRYTQKTDLGTEITNGELFLYLAPDPMAPNAGGSTAVYLVERYTVPKMLQKNRMPLPADSLLNYAKAVHAANPSASGLLAKIQAVETAWRKTQSPSTRTAVAIQEQKTAVQLLRKNLQEGIPSQVMIGVVNMGNAVSRAGTPPPKFTIGKWRNGLLDLKVQKERIAGKKWLAVDGRATPNELYDGIYWQVTKYPFQLDGEELSGLDFVTNNVVYIRTRWEGLDRNGHWFGPWSPFKKYTIPKAGR